MDKLEKVEKKCIELKHNFFCDNCGKELGSTVELEDGYYPELGEFELSFNLDGWYKVKAHFCDQCRKEFIESLKTQLINMGFKKDN